MADRLSGLKFFSLGIVAKTKNPGDPWVEVDPIEQLPMDLGDISERKNIRVSVPTQTGVMKSSNIKKGSTVKAKWLPFGQSNRDTPPDVVAGETIMIFSYADTQEFTWTTVFNEPELRRLERVRYIWSNQPKGMTPATSSSSYFVEVDTIDKIMRLHTSDNDGEKCAYDVVFDSGAGLLVISDNSGNSITLDSVSGKASVTTTNEIELNTKSVTINAQETVTVNAAAMVVNAPLITKGGVAMSGGSGMTLEGSIVMKGDVAIDGNLHARNLSEG